MSPEQAMGEKAIDARSDVYALGAVTYEMLAGDAPFTDGSVQAIVAQIMTEKPTPLGFQGGNGALLYAPSPDGTRFLMLAIPDAWARIPRRRSRR